MADISTEIQAISEAVYGEQVRGAIVDALEAMNEIDEDAEAYAKGTRGGTPVESSDPAYHNNALYYSEQAAQSAASLVTDTTFTQSGEAADSAAVGKTVDAISETTQNMWQDGDINITTDSGFKQFVLSKYLPAGTYTITVTNWTEYVGTPAIYLFSSDTSFSSEYRIKIINPVRNGRSSRTFTINETAKAIRFYSGNDVSSSAGKKATYTNIQIEEGSESTPYVPFRIAVDAAARSGLLLSSGDTTDRTQDILDMLNLYKTCRLGPGDFYIRNLVMPADSSLFGSGEATRIFMIDGINGIAISMQNQCTVSDLSVYGATEDIEIGGQFAGMVDDISELENLWEDGDVTTGNDSNPVTGFKHLVLSTPIPAGEYAISALVTNLGQEFSGNSVIGFSTSQTTTIGTDSIVASVGLPVGAETIGVISIPTTVYSVRITARTTVSSSSGYQVKWENIQLCAIGSRSGIGWVQTSADIERGIISNCRIRRFNCAGIYCADTGTPVRKAVVVSNCFVRNCNVGLYIRRDSEFNKVSNCAFTACQYGVINRGGNNGISNCSIDGNTTNMLIDDAEGSNGGHGNIDNCSFNHAGGNTGYSLIIRGTGRMLVTGCNFYYGKTLIERSNGNVINGCGYGNAATVSIVGGDCTLLIGCMVKDLGGSDTIFTKSNNTASKIVGCYTRNGWTMNWTEQESE